MPAFNRKEYQMHIRNRVYLLLVLLSLVGVTEGADSNITPETFLTLTPERIGLCQMQRSAVPCERYKLGEKWYLLLYAHVENELTLVKIVELAKDGSLRVQKTRWLHELLWI
jgi:hypothetical protein